MTKANLSRNVPEHESRRIGMVRSFPANGGMGLFNPLFHHLLGLRLRWAFLNGFARIIGAHGEKVVSLLRVWHGFLSNDADNPSSFSGVVQNRLAVPVLVSEHLPWSIYRWIA